MVDNDIIYIHLDFRCGDVRVAAQNAVTIRSIKEFRANGYESLINAAVAGLNAQLRPHVELMINKESEPEGQA